MTEDRLAETKELVRAAYRPVFITLLTAGSFYFIVSGLTGPWVDWWHRVFLFSGAEWVFERPIIKLITKQP